MTGVRVNVVVPTYNRAGYLKAAISSVLQQSYQDIRVFIFDNASTDDSHVVANSFKDDRVTFLRNDSNVGMQKNWEKALTHFKDGIVAFLEDDNIWECRHIEEAVEAFEAFPDASFYFCCARTFENGPGKADQYGYIKPFWLPCASSTMYDITREGLNEFIIRNPFSASSLVAKASALNSIDYQMGSGIWCMDFVWWTDMVTKNHKYIYNPNCNVHYRIHGQSMTSFFSAHPNTSIQTREVIRRNYFKAEALGFIAPDRFKNNIIRLSDFYGSVIILALLSRRSTKEARREYYQFFKRNKAHFSSSTLRSVKLLCLFKSLNIAYFLDDVDAARIFFSKMFSKIRR